MPPAIIASTTARIEIITDPPTISVNALRQRDGGSTASVDDVGAVPVAGAVAELAAAVSGWGETSVVEVASSEPGVMGSS
ncbi:hypothetical protein B5808_13020 [Cnuibacter physcomitrellae]|uniref:Uncharacterized protein n=1 Tax=Cnuibacter physcomitrellae TaxID=1619308 RepID=A0A1X9LP33_9MICO|nr:hypothetical protein B5808_13020 [Cnuibacter physcomitrellae]